MNEKDNLVYELIKELINEVEELRRIIDLLILVTFLNSLTIIFIIIYLAHL